MNQFALIRVGGAISIPEVLRDLGSDAHSVFRAAGLSLKVFEDPENTIPVQALGRLVAKCIAATGCEHFGLLVGQRQAASSLGLEGLLAEQSPDVRTALDSLVRYLHLHDGKGTPSLEVANDTVLLGYSILDTSVPSADQIVDGAMSIAFNIMRRLCGKSWRPTEVMLTRPKPVNTMPFSSFFESPVRFGAEHSALVFTADWLVRPVPEANPLLLQIIEDRVRDLERQLGGLGIVNQIRRVVRTLIRARRCSLELVAHHLNIAPRTLVRYLQRENTDFRKIVDDVRYELARYLLADTSISITQIADSLNFSEHSAFTRAFPTYPLPWP
jgi:AraC-like DNA-binding protein